MTGTGESLTDTHSHEQTYGGRRGHFGFHRPVILSCFVTWPRASSSKRGGRGERHSTSRLERDAGKKAQPSQAPALFSPPPSTHPPTNPPTPLQACHTQTNKLARDYKVMYFNVYAQFHNRPLDLSLFRGHSILPRITHTQSETTAVKQWRCLHNSSSTWSTFTLESASHPRCFTSRATTKHSAGTYKYGCFCCKLITSCTLELEMSLK